jgi:secreted PhoX family phosphatase
MGRFRHEAVAVDAKSGIAYQTQDDNNGCFYRFIPKVKEQFHKGGTLQALKYVDSSIVHTTNQLLKLNKKYECQWVGIDEPDPKANTVHKQAQAKGAAVFVRGEGIVVHTDGIYFACTTGGKEGVGQFFKYIPNNDNQTGTIQLVFEAKKYCVLEKPDNITINQWCDLIICEDNSLDEQCLVGLTPQGKIYHIAVNSQSEWAGACFSPDGQILFANIHKDPGMTIAIQGDWKSLRV